MAAQVTKTLLWGKAAQCVSRLPGPCQPMPIETKTQTAKKNLERSKVKNTENISWSEFVEEG